MILHVYMTFVSSQRILIFNIVLEVLAIAIRPTKEIRGTQIRKKESNLSLFADDTTLYIENTKDTAKELLEQINEFSKDSGYKIYIEICCISIH